MQVRQPTEDQACDAELQAGQIFVIFYGDKKEIAALGRDKVAHWAAQPGPKQCYDRCRPKAIKEAKAAISNGALV